MGNVKRKSSSLLLKRSRTITRKDSPVNHATSLKPQRTRQLIRRFHLLQKNKSSIFKLLEKHWEKAVSEDNYLPTIKSNSLLNNIYTKRLESTLKIINLKSPSSITFNEFDSEKLLVQLLGQIDAEIEKRGGLKTYQTASTLGQARGGDSSKKLMEWLQHYPNKSNQDVTALEIGCLSSQNLISTSKFFSNVVRIDLRSQEPNLILEQDFMKRPLPKSEEEKFNLVSCSLVVNFVPTAVERGDMLKRIREFLKVPKNDDSMKPMLFLVLPLPCVSNSRYFDNNKLDEIMEALGFKKKEYHEAKKVAYWLWEWDGDLKVKKQFGKKEIHGGSKRNNFCIVIE